MLIKRKIPRNYLSEKYEMSARTVTRYIDVLTKSGIPIESRKGTGGGYILPADYKLDRMLLTDAERARIAEVLRHTLPLYTDELNRQILSKLDTNAD